MSSPSRPHLETFGQMAELAQAACAAGPVMNLTLTMEKTFPVEEPFLSTYETSAQRWQSPSPAPEMPFTHRQYMNRGGDGMEYVCRQLKANPTTNRACVSLLTTEDLIGSGDEARPSFLLMQAGYDGSDPSVLYMTIYFRALEVSEFLPVNLCEAAILANEISRSIPLTSKLNLTIIAFRAYQQAEFMALRRAALDFASADDIAATVRTGDRQAIDSWLAEKGRPSSVVEVDGTVRLLTELESSGTGDPSVIRPLREAIGLMTQLKEMRKNGSHAELIDSTQAQIESTIREARDALARLSSP